MPDLDQIKQGEQVSARPARGRSLKPPTIEDGVRAGGFLAGRPEDIIEALKAVEKRYPGLDLDRFAKEVIPAFRDTGTAAAAQ